MEGQGRIISVFSEQGKLLWNGSADSVDEVLAASVSKLQELLNAPQSASNFALFLENRTQVALHTVPAVDKYILKSIKGRDVIEEAKNPTILPPAGTVAVPHNLSKDVSVKSKISTSLNVGDVAFEQPKEDVRIAVCLGLPSKEADHLMNAWASRLKDVLENGLPPSDQFNKHAVMAELNLTVVPTSRTELLAKVGVIAKFIFELEKSNRYRPVLVFYTIAHGLKTNSDVRIISCSDGKFLPLNVVISAFAHCKRSLKFFLFETCAFEREEHFGPEQSAEHGIWPLCAGDLFPIKNSVVLFSAAEGYYSTANGTFSSSLSRELLHHGAAGRSWQDTFTRVISEFEAAVIDGVKSRRALYQRPELRIRISDHSDHRKFAFVTKIPSPSILVPLGVISLTTVLNSPTLVSTAPADDEQQSMLPELSHVQHVEFRSKEITLQFPEWILHASQVQLKWAVVSSHISWSATQAVKLEMDKASNAVIYKFTPPPDGSAFVFSYRLSFGMDGKHSGWSRPHLVQLEGQILSITPALSWVDAGSRSRLHAAISVELFSPFYIQARVKTVGTDWIEQRVLPFDFQDFDHVSELCPGFPGTFDKHEIQVRLGNLARHWTNWSDGLLYDAGPEFAFDSGNAVPFVSFVTRSGIVTQGSNIQYCFYSNGRTFEVATVPAEHLHLKGTSSNGKWEVWYISLEKLRLPLELSRDKGYRIQAKLNDGPWTKFSSISYWFGKNKQ